MAFQRNGVSRLAASATVPLIAFAPLFLGHSAWSQTSPIKIVVPPQARADDSDRESSRRHHGDWNRCAVARATSDGTTLLVNAPPAFVIIPHLRRLNYDPLTSFEPVCNLVKFPTHIGFEMLKRATNIKMTFVPYAGAAPAVNALLGNHVTSYFGNYADRRLLKPATKTMRWKVASDCSHPRKRRRKQFLSSQAGSPRQCKSPT